MYVQTFSKKSSGKTVAIFPIIFSRRVLTNWGLSITLHTVDFTVKKLHLFLQFIDYFLHGWSRPRLSLQASPYQATKRAICYKHHLFFTSSRIWKLPDTHFTKKSTKAVNINLTTIHHLHQSIFFPGISVAYYGLSSATFDFHCTDNIRDSCAPQPS